MNIIGIDPGYDRVGIAVLEKNGGKETLLYSSCFQTSKDADVNDRINDFINELQKIIKE